MMPKDQIRCAAFGILNTEGVDAVTIRSVAEASNYGRSTVVHHFGDKAGLLDALHIAAAEQYVTEVLRQPLSYRSGTVAEPVMAAAYPDPTDDDQAVSILVRLEQFRANAPGGWELLRFRRCPDFDGATSPLLVDVLDTLARGGLSRHRGRAVDVFIQQILSLHEFRMELSSAENERVALASPTSTYFLNVFGIAPSNGSEAAAENRPAS